MKNVIVILVDSVFSECISNNKTKISCTPFIDTLKDSAIFAPCVYSYGPYTDAASKALFCGNRTLDDYGYFFGLNSSEYNHFRLFHEAGYETFGLYYPYYLLGSSIEKYIDHSLYTDGFKYVSVWGGKLEYYAEKQKKTGLTHQEYFLLVKCMEMVFDCWRLFYENIDKYSESAQIVKNVFNKELNGSGKDGFYAEFDRFTKAPNSYIDEILKMGMEHPLAKINEYSYGREEDLEFNKEVYDNNGAFFKEISRINAKKNLINNPISIKKSLKCITSYLKSRNKADLRYFGNYGMLVDYADLMKRRSVKSKWQECASFNKQIEALLKALDERDSDSSKPFYASVHPEEPHHNVAFFSYDSFDHKLIQEEIDYLYPLINACGKKFSGNLVYSLSLRYVDLCVKRLFEQLEKRGLLDNTTIMLMSDHGSSYFFDPARNYVVNTFHKENYNVPLLIWDKELPKDMVGDFNGWYSSDDIFPTLCDVVGLDVPKGFTGTSILKNVDGRDYVMVEYMGPGVPDMLHKEVWLAIRNNKYVIAYKNPIDKDIDLSNPCIVYDLMNDPLELRNYAGKIEDNQDILVMKKILKERYCEIQQETKSFLNNLEQK